MLGVIMASCSCNLALAWRKLVSREILRDYHTRVNIVRRLRLVFYLDSRFDKRIVSHLKKFASRIFVNPREKSKIEIDNAICARDATSAHVNIENDGTGG
ncbi:hypothetical protein PUN28_014504 [Cardiocondyla obscurior]|uniref:Uncharacterized protein n=1 Tax=Cardiocondyla obscurior TaxID=286306 RepID=A0AAW2F5Q8_9HYME